MFLITLIKVWLSVFTDLSFWQQTGYFISLFCLLILLAGWPLMVAFKDLSDRYRWLLWPIYGLVNLFLLLFVWRNLVMITHWGSETMFPVIAGLYGLEWLGLKLFGPHLKIIPLAPKPGPPAPLRLALIGIYLILFTLITARQFDPGTHTFFVPGYEVNHDAIGLVGGIKLMALNLDRQPAYVGAVGYDLLHHYPLGSLDLELLFSLLFKVDPYFIFSRVINASFLLVIYIPVYLLYRLKLVAKNQERLMVLGICLFTGLNYLSATFLDTAVLGTTLLIPLTFLAFVILYLGVRGINSWIQTLVFLFVTLLVGVYVYTYVILLYTGLFGLGLWVVNRRRFTPKMIIGCLVVAFATLVNPHNYLDSQDIFHRQFFSSSKEINAFLGMQGNLGNFLNPVMGLSAWFSSANYLTPGLGVGNTYIVVTILVLGLLVLALFKPQPVTFDRNQLILALTFPVAVLLGMSLLVTHSPYENAKVLQFAAVLWPVLIYLIFLPVIRHRLIGFYPILIMAIGVGSGLFCLTYVGTPIVSSGLDLQQLAPSLCAHPQQPLQVLSRDEWAKYWLQACHQVDYAFDRATHWDQLVAFNVTNHRYLISEPCSPGSLNLTPGFKPQAGDLLMDRCLEFTDPRYRLVASDPVYRQYVSIQVVEPARSEK